MCMEACTALLFFNAFIKKNKTFFMNIIAAQLDMERMFEESHKNTNLAGRFSPHKNFTEALTEWCEKHERNIRVWALSSIRFFSLKARFPEKTTKEIVIYCLWRDKKILELY